MMRFPALLASAALAMAALPAAALTIYTTTLDQNEPVPTGSPGTGTARVTIDGTLMRVEASFSGLLGTTTVSHIHCCTAAADTGPAGVATTTPTFPGFPAGVTAGSYDMTFDMTMASSYNPAFITNNGGTAASAFSALVEGLDAGKAYFNIHTSEFGGGEIRGFLHAIPEPETYALMLLGLAAVGLAARRRRN
ncbi:MAG TPA: CHRD domain-containing protein [Albitalea sp.]